MRSAGWSLLTYPPSPTANRDHSGGQEVTPRDKIAKWIQDYQLSSVNVEQDDQIESRVVERSEVFFQR